MRTSHLLKCGWLEKEINYTHPTVQNEIIHILGNEIVSGIVENIKASNPLIYSVICEGPRDISGYEQVSFCVRWVDVRWILMSFLGFHQMEQTCDTDIAPLLM